MSDPSFQYFTPHRVGPHRGVRTDRYKLIEYYSEGDYWELFDLKEDPNELKNLYGNPESAQFTAELKQELMRLRTQYRTLDKASLQVQSSNLSAILRSERLFRNSGLNSISKSLISVRASSPSLNREYGGISHTLECNFNVPTASFEMQKRNPVAARIDRTLSIAS